MNSIDQKYLGKLVKKVRKEKGLSLEELTDEAISRSTLSRLENGKSVEAEKVKAILEKLDINDEDIPHLMKEVKQEEEINQFVFKAIETQVRHDVLSASRFNEKLAIIRLPAAGKYLRAKRYFIRENYKSACKLYRQLLPLNF